LAPGGIFSGPIRKQFPGARVGFPPASRKYNRHTGALPPHGGPAACLHPTAGKQIPPGPRFRQKFPNCISKHQGRLNPRSKKFEKAGSGGTIRLSLFGPEKPPRGFRGKNTVRTGTPARQFGPEIPWEKLAPWLRKKTSGVTLVGENPSRVPRPGASDRFNSSPPAGVPSNFRRRTIAGRGGPPLGGRQISAPRPVRQRPASPRVRLFPSFPGTPPTEGDFNFRRNVGLLAK